MIFATELVLYTVFGTNSCNASCAISNVTSGILNAALYATILITAPSKFLISLPQLFAI